MREKNRKNALYRTACAVLAAGVLCQTSIPAAYAVSDRTDPASASYSTSYSLKDDLSKNGNPVTEYYNQEDQQTKTILWTQGITPPRMGGDNSQFDRVVTEVKGTTFVEYTSPYLPNQGWYDVNKSTNFEQNDANLCFAAAAANSLHWWMDRNSANIDRYLELNQDAHVQELAHLRHSFGDQQHSGVYNIFRNQFAGKTDGYWSDLLHDQFLNGYYLTGGGTNDIDSARDKLLTEGPDKHGGFFFDVFNTKLLTDRRYYNMGFDSINRELKSLLMSGNIVLMVYDMKNISHIVTLWGAEYDPNGNICAVYYTDSDDQASAGMQRYRVMNIGGTPVVTTSLDGSYRSPITCLQILSPGTELWERYFQGPRTVLELNWSDTELTYNGQKQAPTVTATNIAANDNITLSVRGGAVNAGSYTATVELSGPDADKYELPADYTHPFTIRKAAAPQIVYPSAGALQYGDRLGNSLLMGGSTEYGSFYWDDTSVIPPVSNSGYHVHFSPSNSTNQNYELPATTSMVIPVDVRKATPTVIVNASVTPTEDSNTVTATAILNSVGYGEIPTGTVTFEIVDETGSPVSGSFSDVAIVNGMATTSWSSVAGKTFTVKAVYSGSGNYTEASSTAISVDVEKQAQEGFKMHSISDKTYGDSSFTLEAVGGNGTGAITYESSDSSILSISGNTAIIHKAGTVTVTAVKAGDEIYNAASSSVSVVVNKREVTITAKNQSNVMQGDAMPELTYTVEGLVNGDSYANPKLTVSIADTNVPGDYTIFIQGGDLTNAESYSVTYVTGTLSIQEKELPPVPPTPSKPDVDNNPTDGNNAGGSPVKPPVTPVKPVTPAQPTPPATKPTTGETEENTTAQSDTSVPTAPTVTAPAETDSTEPAPEDAQDSSALPEKDTSAESGSNEVTAPDKTENKQEKESRNTGMVIAISLIAVLIIAASLVYVFWKKNQPRKRR